MRRISSRKCGRENKRKRSGQWDGERREKEKTREAGFLESERVCIKSL
jgi:hypothetical protein